MTSIKRVAPGTPTGGQFATDAKAPADLNDLDLNFSTDVGTDPEHEGACSECGGPMTVDANGISNHTDQNGAIDYDLDAEHVALLEDFVEPISDALPTTETRTLDAPLPRVGPNETRTTSTPMQASAAEHRRLAAEALQRQADSYENSDTDGFVSQWASGINANLHATQARILENGGVSTFTALADLDGNLVPAKMVDTKFGLAWGVLSDPTDNDSSFETWVNRSKASTAAKRVAALEKKGYREVVVLAPARAQIIASGTGLSGAASAYVGIRRTDGGFSPDAKIVDMNADTDD